MNDIANEELTAQDVRDAEVEALEDDLTNLLYEIYLPLSYDRALVDEILDRFRIRLEPREDEQR